jgi:hypothetical protein
LAATAGLQHAVLYTGTNHTTEFGAARQDASGASLPLRNQARNLDMCVPLEVTFARVARMVEEWQTCCVRGNVMAGWG